MAATLTVCFRAALYRSMSQLLMASRDFLLKQGRRCVLTTYRSLDDNLLFQKVCGKISKMLDASLISLLNHAVRKNLMGLGYEI